MLILSRLFFVDASLLHLPAGCFEADVEILELVRRVEHVGLATLGWLELPRILEQAGLGGKQQAAVIGNVIGRMAAPASELATWGWLRERSGLGELLEVDFEAIPLMSLYRASDLLVKHRQPIEAALFSRISDLFSLPTTVTLFDLTNTYFEGEMAGNSKALAFEGKTQRLPAGDPGLGARRQRLCPALTDV